jgi:hypothetical protein
MNLKDRAGEELLDRRPVRCMAIPPMILFYRMQRGFPSLPDANTVAAWTLDVLY